MTPLSIPALLCGGPAHMPHSTELKAGPVSLFLEQGELRRLRVGDVEVLRRAYLTLRGPDWGTISPALSELRVDAGEGEFSVSFTLSHKQGEFDFSWRVKAMGNRQGTIRFEARGRAGSAF